MTVIVGAGGAGLYYACLAKEKDPDAEIIVIEEHLDIGKPIQCTGILTDEIESLVLKEDLERFTLNRINFTTVFSPNDKVTIPLKTNYIIDNVAFIEYLYARAKKAGVKILLGKRYLGNQGNRITIRDIKTKKSEELADNRLIGADGPGSEVAKNNGLYLNREFLTGVQARIKFEELDREKIEFFPYIGEYAWSAPESEDVSRIGVASRSNAKVIYDDFIKRYPGKKLEIQGGPIPLHMPGVPVRVKEDEFSVTLLGDAALQIKNTTGGGIIPGMRAAKILADDFDNYEINLKPLNRELYAHYILNKALTKYSHSEWDRLIRKARSKRIQKILAERNRDNAFGLLLRLALSPSMLLEALRAYSKII